MFFVSFSISSLFLLLPRTFYPMHVLLHLDILIVLQSIIRHLTMDVFEGVICIWCIIVN